MNGLRRDLVAGLRGMWRSRGLTVVAVLSLGLGIGANSAIWSVVHAVLLRPLPYAEPERLVRVVANATDRGITDAGLSYARFVNLARDARAFSALGAFV